VIEVDGFILTVKYNDGDREPENFGVYLTLDEAYKVATEVRTDDEVWDVSIDALSDLSKWTEPECWACDEPKSQCKCEDE
jgi:hypothetical protein